MNAKNRPRRVEAYHDAWAFRYDDGYWSKAGLYHEVTRESIQSLLPTRVDARILDLGCGTGIWAQEILSQGFRDLTLVDISRQMLERCRRALGHRAEGCRFLQLDALDLRDLPSNSFDLVIAQGDVLSYCGSSSRAASEIFRTTRPGGVALASVEGRIGNARRLLQRGELDAARKCLETGELMVGNPQWARPFPAEAFSPETLKSTLASAGFDTLWLKGKTVFECDLSLETVRSCRCEWLVDFERENNQLSNHVAGCLHIEIAAKKAEPHAT